MRFWGTSGQRDEGRVKLSTKETGEWHVSRGMVTVSYGAYEKSAPLGAFALNPQPLARILLAELVTTDLSSKSSQAVDKGNTDGHTGTGTAL